MNEPSIDLRAWRQFLAVADELHFGRAATRLHMTQPPLTQAIAQLERNLGVALFHRSSRHVALTPAGEALLPQVRELLARSAALPGLARAAAAGEVGRVRLAFVSTIGFTRLPLWVRDFVAGTPGVALELVEATSDVQMQAFERGQIDAGLMLHAPGHAPAGLQCLAVGREPMVLALPAQHALAGTDRLMLDEVLEQPLVIFPRRIMPSLHDAVMDLYRQHGKVPRIAQQAIQMQTIVNLVWGGIGLAWVPASVMQFCRPGVVYREVVHAAGATRAGRKPVALPTCETSLAWPADALSPALARFVEFVRAQG
ncbi:Hca operon transcriptional activator [Delftia tsuruhatensis]|uniref:LysR family transcriptional regulator n=1 Tax=Delftia tsuruhatensis TaxID=180282 RepID=UPI001E6A6910|nr:LysR family transcriptional regulator [Delftia tsuruhatensis]CAB5722188.1 Hca operon transcriptional activator [Delftia tsuruhatensis]CAC9686579.1 Hca operon transcriptional activator [Delftia tsuruhatensis]